VKDILLVWRDPNGSLSSEQFNGERFAMRLDPGWLKIQDKKDSEIVRIIPSDKVCLIEYVEHKPEPSNLIRPGPLAIPGGN
jgi:hypothetical protein